MIRIERAGKDPLEIEFILIDFEGTLASDRRVHPKAKDKINLLSKRTKIYIVSTFEKELVEGTLRKVKAEWILLPEGETSLRKLDLLMRLGAEKTAAVGGGADDVPMIEKAALGLSVLGREGTSGEAIAGADVVFLNIIDALDFLLRPLRQRAALAK